MTWIFALLMIQQAHAGFGMDLIYWVFSDFLPATQAPAPPPSPECGNDRIHAYQHCLDNLAQQRLVPTFDYEGRPGNSLAYFPHEGHLYRFNYTGMWRFRAPELSSPVTAFRIQGPREQDYEFLSYEVHEDGDRQRRYSRDYDVPRNDGKLTNTRVSCGNDALGEQALRALIRMGLENIPSRLEDALREVRQACEGVPGFPAADPNQVIGIGMCDRDALFNCELQWATVFANYEAVRQSCTWGQKFDFELDHYAETLDLKAISERLRH